ncbi:sodium transport system ATP-binding protein [Natronincola peptidivorans]|uniref:Sodium transport system ATP-binding protein n=1 Tax=Natronincola peptidivorans TaxID=426128 RepID=A0A1I0GS37_9FIRM|nr:ATP-binding cassette domain-containing protein [Natronincola peptidivorans]SET73996.1 sodium transport system ATP-binding protein [Natronincola peptidivorans]
MIQVINIKKKFYDKKHGDFYAVDDASFEVEKGEIFGLLGPNGAGKTTLLRIMATIMEQSAGKIIVNGYDTQSQPEGVRKSIGFLSGNTKLYKKLTPVETMRFFGKFYGIKKEIMEKRIEQIIHNLQMEDFKDRIIEKLSTGQVQKTSIARCMIHDPEVYILDEPTLGLDILTSRTIIDFIKAKKEEGKTIIFSTHYMEEADSLCDRIGLIHKGKIIETGTIESLKKKTGKTNIRDIFLSYIDRGDMSYELPEN